MTIGIGIEIMTEEIEIVGIKEPVMITEIMTEEIEIVGIKEPVMITEIMTETREVTAGGGGRGGLVMIKMGILNMTGKGWRKVIGIEGKGGLKRVTETGTTEATAKAEEEGGDGDPVRIEMVKKEEENGLVMKEKKKGGESGLVRNERERRGEGEDPVMKGMGKQGGGEDLVTKEKGKREEE